MDANLSLRIGSAVVGVPLVIGLVGWGALWLFSAVLFVLTVIALREFFGLCFPGRPLRQVCGILFGIGLAVTIFFENRLPMMTWFGVAFVALFALYLLTPGGSCGSAARLVVDDSWRALRRLSLPSLARAFRRS